MDKIILTEEIKAYVRDAYKTQTIVDIAKHYKVSNTTVRKWLIELEIPFKKRNTPLKKVKVHKYIFNPYERENWLI